MTRELQPCGTYGAYLWHKRNGVPVDDACREACRRRSADYRAAHGETVRAQDAALKRRTRARKRLESAS